MKILLGVMGPHDLVELVANVLVDDEHFTVIPLPYDHEGEAPELVRAEQSRVDAWLFTGIIPYTAAEANLTAPASYLDYNGSTILQGLVRLLRSGHDVSTLSVDTLRTQDVKATLAEVDIPTERVRVLPYTGGSESSATIAFHRRNIERDPATVIITCVSSVFEALRDTTACLRLVPSIPSIRGAVSELFLRATNQVSEQAQVAIGLAGFGDQAKPADPAGWMIKALPGLGATAATTLDGLPMVVTTRGSLALVTREFTVSPFAVTPPFDGGGVGFGVGNSAVEAEGFARRALGRALAAPSFAAVVSFRSNLDTVLTGASEPSDGSALTWGWGSLAARTGLSIPTLERVKSIVDGSDGEPLSTRDLADALGVQLRTARRMIRHFEMVGFAERVGLMQDNQPGRPLTLYRIKI